MGQETLYGRKMGEGTLYGPRQPQEKGMRSKNIDLADKIVPLVIINRLASQELGFYHSQTMSVWAKSKQMPPHTCFWPEAQRLEFERKHSQTVRICPSVNPN